VTTLESTTERLEEALRRLAVEAADLLEELLASGAELPFDLEPTDDGPLPMYSYAPLTGQFIADERAESPFERAAELLTKEALKEALENLSYRERRVLELRYGLGGEHPRTLDEVGRTFNVTRERIRQIENQSLKKLQSLAEAQKLREVA
jgi:RNA polymerase sigma factor (sigma-70 family)